MEDHFVEITEMIEIGKGGQRPVKTVMMSRYACYLVIQNADPAKEIVALGQTYFAGQTRRQELTDQEIEEQRRLLLRTEMKAHNVQLADAAKGAGVVEPKDYAIFQNHGYAGLYGGLLAQDIHARKGLKKGQQISCYQRDIARFVHVQMQEHYWEKATGYEVKISKGFSELKQRAYTASATEPVLDYRQPPADKSNMAKYLFGGFKRCLYQEEKFQSDTERKLSVILEREAEKWLKPAKGQFQIYYKSGADHLEYQPDFVAETEATIYMLEPKRRDEMADVEVVAKKDVAVKWCKQASDHAKIYKGKPWKYLLIPHDVIAENMTLEWLAAQFGVS